MILTIGTRKGGAGKSTITTNLAAMRALRKHEVCLVDTDDQQSSAMWAAIRAEEPEEEGAKKPLYIPAVSVTGKGTLAAISAQAEKYSDLIIDVPGRDASELRAAVMASDVLAIPLRPSQFDLWAFQKDLELVETTRIVKESVGAKFRTIIFFNGISTSPVVKSKELAKFEKYLGNKDVLPFLQENKIEICSSYISNRGIYNKVVGEGLSVHEVAVNGVSDDHARFEMEMLYKYIYGSQK